MVIFMAVYMLVNPYLAIAAIVGCANYGLENNLALDIPASKCDKTTVTGERLPRSLREATVKMMEPDSMARKVLGDEFVDHYAATRLHECREWEQSITNWEACLEIHHLYVQLSRYMEVI